MSSKPNIIVFMTDQQNALTVGRDKRAKTPNLDKFLSESVNFTECYTCAPHCCPSRASFFSSLYPSQHGVWNNVEVDNALSRGLYDDIELFPELLKKQDYHNVFSGKWHVSSTEGPLDRGFDKVLREQTSNYGRTKPTNMPRYNDWRHVYVPGAEMDTENDCSSKEDGRIVRPGYPGYYQYGINENPFNDTDTTEMSCEYIESYDYSSPLFMYVGTIGPHDPYFVPQRFLDMYDIDDIDLPQSFYDDMEDKPALYRRTKSMFALSENEHRESIRRYLAFVSYEDYLFGRVLQSIEASGQGDNTVVIYTSDHGDYLANHGLWAKGLPCFKEAYNIPLAIRGEGFSKGTICDNLTSITDIAPTILSIAGTAFSREIIGKSLAPVLRDESPDDVHTEIYTQTNGNEIYGIQRAVWNKKWKYVFNTFDFDELYDLENDPSELSNLLPNPELNKVVREMCKYIWTFAKRTNDGCTCPYIMVSFAPYGPGITL